MDILKRSLAPISEDAWKKIDDQASYTLKGNLSARRIVDFSGPHGWSLGAINLGRLDIPKSSSTKGVTWGLRKVQPLVEIRVPFKLDIMELDSVTRGSKDVELEPLCDAAQNAAVFEETALYYGFDKGNITGLLKATPHKAITMSSNAAKFSESVETALVTIEKTGIGGPFTLVLGTKAYALLMKGDEKGYPLKKRILDMIRGDILWSPVVEGGAIVSTRGGDYELTVGQDLAIGYCAHDRDKVELFITESFTFQIIEPRAAIELKISK